MAPECLDVFAQGRDLERPAGGDHRHGTVLDAGGHGLEACSLDPADHFGRQHGGGDIDVAVRLADERVAHGAADDASFLAVTLKRGENAAQRRLSQPFGIEAAPPLCHFVSPGTNCPSSTWAGTSVGPGGEPPHCASTTKLPIMSMSAAITSHVTRGRLQALGCSTPAWVAHRKTA